MGLIQRVQKQINCGKVVRKWYAYTSLHHLKLSWFTHDVDPKVPLDTLMKKNSLIYLKYQNGKLETLSKVGLTNNNGDALSEKKKRPCPCCQMFIIRRHSPRTSAELLSQMETSWCRKQKGVSQQICITPTRGFRKLTYPFRDSTKYIIEVYIYSYIRIYYIHVKEQMNIIDLS